MPDETPKPEDKKTDETGLTKKERIAAGILLVVFTCIPVIFIVWLWPDRLPDPQDFIKPLYYTTPFHVRLAGIRDEVSFQSSVHQAVGGNFILKPKNDNKNKDAQLNDEALVDSGDITTDSSDTAAAASIAANPNTIQKPQPALNQKEGSDSNDSIDETKLLHINTILLILVALGGFMGNMVYIAASFTTYVGNKKFVKSWLLWYCVKPFSAAALAIVVYFVFRGGFLNTSDDVSNINLFGLMTISLLAGLFTDRATLKLKEVFDVIFNPKEERADALTSIPKINSISPVEIEAAKENIITIAGENLTSKQLTATINDEAVDISVSNDTSASIKYNIPDSQKDAIKFVLIIKDEDKNIAGSGVLTLKAANNAGEQQ